MRPHVIARKTHKWLGLFIGLQVVIWSLSGLYMTIVHIDTIHGDHLVQAAPKRSVAASSLADPVKLAAATGAQSIRLGWLDGKPIYIAGRPSGEIALDARSGNRIPAPDEAAIRKLAASSYTGREPVASAALISDIPGEIRGRKPPLWRVEFDHWNKPTFYLSPASGELLTRRHELWRIFDFVWMLHIMDYDERENVNNALLRLFTWGAVLMALSGIWLLFYSFHRKKKKKAARP